jgi:hypothetical protein
MVNIFTTYFGFLKHGTGCRVSLYIRELSQTTKTAIGEGSKKVTIFFYISLIKLIYVGGGGSKSSRFLSTWFVEAPKDLGM